MSDQTNPSAKTALDAAVQYMLQESGFRRDVVGNLLAGINIGVALGLEHPREAAAFSIGAAAENSEALQALEITGGMAAAIEAALEEAVP